MPGGVGELIQSQTVGDNETEFDGTGQGIHHLGPERYAGTVSPDRRVLPGGVARGAARSDHPAASDGHAWQPGPYTAHRAPDRPTCGPWTTEPAAVGASRRRAPRPCRPRAADAGRRPTGSPGLADRQRHRTVRIDDSRPRGHRRGDAGFERMWAPSAPAHQAAGDGRRNAILVGLAHGQTDSANRRTGRRADRDLRQHAHAGRFRDRRSPYICLFQERPFRRLVEVRTVRRNAATPRLPRGTGRCSVRRATAAASTLGNRLVRTGCVPGTIPAPPRATAPPPLAHFGRHHASGVLAARSRPDTAPGDITSQPRLSRPRDLHDGAPAPNYRQMVLICPQANPSLCIDRGRNPRHSPVSRQHR
jgi:hypothetical protein